MSKSPKKNPPSNSQAPTGRKTTAQGQPPPQNPSPDGATQIPLEQWVSPRTEKAIPSNYPHEPYIGLDDVESNTSRLIGSKSPETMKSAAKRFYPGDVLYSRLRPYLNKVWLADRSGLCSAEFIVLPSNDSLDGAYLTYRLSAMDFVSFANSLNAGDRPRVDFEQISVFPLPPYSRSYQHRIVAKIEELFSELDAGEESLRLARKKLSVYRQSLLKQAFEGKLTEHWRKQNPHLLESPDELLNRIQEERQARYVDQLKYWQDNRKNGKKVSKPKRPEYATAIPDEALTALPQMPIGWLWCLLGTVCEFANGDRGKNYPNRNEYVAQGIPWINTGHIEPDGSLSSDRMNFITREKFESLSGGRIQPTA